MEMPITYPEGAVRTKYVKCFAWLLYFMMSVCAVLDFSYHQPRLPTCVPLFSVGAVGPD